MCISKHRAAEFLSCVTLAAGAATAAGAAVPSPGAILQPLQPTLTAPAVPPAVIVLPKPSKQKSKSKILIPVSQLVIKGNRLLSTKVLHRLVAPAEHKSLTLAALNRYVDRIASVYQAAGYPVAYAYLPAQTIRNGKIVIQVVEPVYDQVIVTGKSRFKANEAKHVADIKSGTPVALHHLSRSLLLLSQTPGVQIKGVLVPGRKPRTTSLKIRRKDLPIWFGTLGAENYGNTSTGKTLLTASVAARNPFGYGSSFAANLVSSDTGGLTSEALSATSPDLKNGLRLGAYASTAPYQLGDAFASLGQSGRSDQVGVDATYPVILQPGRILNLRFDLLRNWLEQNTAASGSHSTQRLDIARLSTSGAFQSARFGLTEMTASLSHGLLQFGSAADRANDASSAQTAGIYNALRLSVKQSRKLANGIRLSFKISGQATDRNIDSSQQMFLGGPNGVMSVPAGSIGGDEGVLLRARIGHDLAIKALPGRLTASVLAQFGQVWTRHSPYAGMTGTNIVSVGGVGLGVDYRLNNVRLSLAYAVPFGGNAPRSEVPSDGQIWIAASTNF